MSGQEVAAGRSAREHAARLRQEARGGLWRAVLRAVGLDRRGTAVEAVAGRWEAGARGEEMTAVLLAPLGERGWGGFYDRRLPTGRANFDHVLVAPSGDLVVLVDSKLWSRRHGAVERSADGRLVHGGDDRSGAVRSLRYETSVLARELARRGVEVPVVPVIVMHSAPVAGGRFKVGDVCVVEAAGLVGLLTSWSWRPGDQAAFDRLAAAADAVLPRYVEGTGR